MWLILILVALSTPAHATRITTGTITGANTNAAPQVAEISATPISSIRLDVGGQRYASTTSPLRVTITVNTSTPAVTAGSAPNQSFRDDAAGAAFFGYYLTTGVRSSNQAAASVNVKVKVGAGATANRSFYLLGNGTTTPTVQGALTAAPAVATTFVSIPPNVVRCGPSYAANGLTGTAIGCVGGPTVANMNITQFVKVQFSDPTSAAIVSRLEFTAVNE